MGEKRYIDFRRLGNGRNRKRVFVVDAKTGKVLFASEILHNWPSWKRIVFSNGRKYSTATGELDDGIKAEIREWSLDLEEQFRKQVANERVSCILPTLEPETLYRVVYLEAMYRAGKQPQPFYVWSVSTYLREVELRLKYWSAYELERLACDLKSLLPPRAA